MSYMQMNSTGLNVIASPQVNFSNVQPVYPPMIKTSPNVTHVRKIKTRRFTKEPSLKTNADVKANLHNKLLLKMKQKTTGGRANNFGGLMVPYHYSIINNHVEQSKLSEFSVTGSLAMPASPLSSPYGGTFQYGSSSYLQKNLLQPPLSPYPNVHDSSLITDRGTQPQRLYNQSQLYRNELQSPDLVSPGMSRFVTSDHIPSITTTSDFVSPSEFFKYSPDRETSGDKRPTLDMLESPLKTSNVFSASSSSLLGSSFTWSFNNSNK